MNCYTGTHLLESTASDWLTATRADLFNPPGLNNLWGSCQAAPDVMGIRNLIFPPWSQGDVVLATLSVNGTCISASGQPVNYRWRADRIERRTRISGLDIQTMTAMEPLTQSACIRLAIRNESPSTQCVKLGIRTGEGVVHAPESWDTPYPPKEKPTISVTPWEGAPPPRQTVRNQLEHLEDGSGILYRSVTSVACSLQVMHPRPDSIRGPSFHFARELGPGETLTFHFWAGVDSGPEALRSRAARWRSDPDQPFALAETFWAAELEAAFTPGNNRFSGWLPRLHTENPALLRVYLNATLAAIYMKKEHPLSACGRTYTTLAPAYWQTTSFINDWSLCSLLLCMLDPQCARQHIETWLQRDILSHFGTEYATGADAGNWYSCNDYAMTRLISHHLRLTRDHSWLKTRCGELTIREHLIKMAWHYRELAGNDGLADYGDRNSLLEAVGSYQHQVASLNAAAVWILREVAEILEFQGEDGEAGRMRDAAQTQIRNLQELYLPGEGFWLCRYPDGSTYPVRHIWDFIHAFNFLADDLPASQCEEMLEYFFREHHTANWCRALSPLDDDIDFSLRPDHQWNGSYPAWVALAARSLARGGRHRELADWLPGLAASANQGPYSQAHFTEDYAAPVNNGARKAPVEWPYINDWMNLAGGAFFDMILEAVFGLQTGLDSLSAQPQLDHIDPGASLENLPCAGQCYTVNAEGVAVQD